MRNDTFRKTLVACIIVLFISMNFISSSGNKIDNVFDNPYNSKGAIISKELPGCNHLAYLGADLDYYSFYEFILNDPGNLTDLCNSCNEGSRGPNYWSGGTWTDDQRFFACEYDGFLYEIDIDTCEIKPIGSGCPTGLNGLAYNPNTDILYGCSSTDLFEIDPEYGDCKYIGPFKTGTSMIAIACDANGSLYGWDAKFSGDSYLYKIDTETGEATTVGSLDMTLCYSQDGDFCKEDDSLYLAAYTLAPNKGSYLYECDKQTGKCTLVGQFGNNHYATILAIPYDYNPPVTTHILDPPEPDGLNGWYISNVNVTLNARDDISGVKEIIYEVDGEQGIIKGDNGTFYITEEFDKDDLFVEYWAIDNAGNEESKNNFTIDIDQTKPILDLTYEILGGNQFDGWDLQFTADAEDETSGMDRVEFYKDDELQDTIIGPGPEYSWEFHWDPIFPKLRVTGLICNLEITEEYVNFYAIAVFIRALEPGRMYSICAIGYDIAGNSVYDEIQQPKNLGKISPGLYLFQNLTLSNNYSGHLGRFFIRAEFEQPRRLNV